MPVQRCLSLVHGVQLVNVAHPYAVGTFYVCHFALMLYSTFCYCSTATAAVVIVYGVALFSGLSSKL